MRGINRIDRREALRRLGTVPAMASLSMWPAGAAGSTQSANAVRTGSLISIGNRKQLFLDENLIESLRDTRLTLNPAIKAPENPVIRRDRPWEGNYIHLPAFVVYDEQRQEFRMWFDTTTFSPVPGGNPKDTGWIPCYAVSKDGVNWEKPALGQVEFQGSRSNNILAPENWPGPSFIDLNEKDPGKRYKRLLQKGSTDREGTTVHLYYSPDGLSWTAHAANPVIRWGDQPGRWGPTHYLGWDPIREVYAVYMEICLHRKCPVGKRLIGRAESPDLIHWSDGEPVIVPDELDDPDTEFYNLTTSIYEGYYIGMLWHFRTTNTTHRPFFVFSRDGIHFDRRFRQPFIEGDASPAFDSVSIYAAQPIVKGGKVFIYYGGVNWRSPEHLEQLGAEKAHGAIGLATVPIDGFVSLDGAKLQHSQAVTRSFSFAGSSLHLNMRAAYQRWGAEKCDVRVEILGTDYHPIPGFGLAASDPLETTGSHKVTWKGNGDVGRLAGKPVKLRLAFKNAKLFSFQFR